MPIRSTAPLARRTVFGLVFSAFLLSLGLGRSVHAEPVAAAKNQDAAVNSYRQRQADATPKTVLAWLRAGNDRFAAGEPNHGGFPTDPRKRLRVAAAGQRPLAAVLSCIDSRTAPEIVFDTSVGDLFTVRVGANIINDDVLGSLEIAAESGAKVIVVLGHTNCGGVKAACSGVQMGHLTQLLEKIKPAIASAQTRLDADPARAKAVGERTAANSRYIAEVSYTNAVQSAEQIRRNSPLLREQLARGEILLVSAIFDVDTGRVTFDPTQ